MADFNESLNTLFNKMENFVSSKTVVGEPLQMGGITVVPLVDVVVGVGAGSGGQAASSGGGGGLGAKISPSAVIVLQGGSVQMINVKNQDSVNKLIDMVPGVVNKLNFGPFKTSEAEPKVAEVKFEDKIIIEPDKEKSAAEFEKTPEEEV